MSWSLTVRFPGGCEATPRSWAERLAYEGIGRLAERAGLTVKKHQGHWYFYDNGRPLSGRHGMNRDGAAWFLTHWN
jgi:hypothetical protein